MKLKKEAVTKAQTKIGKASRTGSPERGRERSPRRIDSAAAAAMVPEPAAEPDYMIYDDASQRVLREAPLPDAASVITTPSELVVPNGVLELNPDLIKRDVGERATENEIEIDVNTIKAQAVNRDPDVPASSREVPEARRPRSPKHFVIASDDEGYASATSRGTSPATRFWDNDEGGSGKPPRMPSGLRADGDVTRDLEIARQIREAYEKGMRANEVQAAERARLRGGSTKREYQTMLQRAIGNARVLFRG